jgi:hypothetical protein
MRRQDNYVRQELQKQFSEKHQVDMKFLKVPKVPWRAHFAASYQNSSSPCFYVLICFSYSAVLLNFFALFNSLFKRKDESVWDELYQSTLTLAKSFDIDASYQNSSSPSCFYVLICFSYSAVLLTFFTLL